MECLKWFVETHISELEGMTTEQVCDEIILSEASKEVEAKSKRKGAKELEVAEVEDRNKSYVSFLKRSGLNSFVGKATVFISHPWRCKFLNLVAVLQSWCEQNSEKEYFWFDVFSLDQNQNIPDFRTWNIHFRRFSQGIKKCLMVLSPWDPWKQPIWLERAWCLYEYYVFSESSNIEFVTLNDERKEVVHAMARGRSYEDILSNINLEIADSSVEREGSDLKEHIHSKIGYSQFNQRVRMALKSLLLNVVKEASDSVERQYVLGGVPSDIQYVYSKLLVEMCRFDEAEHLLFRRLRDMIGGRIASGPPEREDGIVIAFEQAVGLRQRPARDATDPREINRLRRRKWRRKLGLSEKSRFPTESESDEEAAEPLSLAQTMNDFAAVSEKLGKLRVAKRWFRSCLDLRAEALGDVHELVASSKHSLGEVLRRLNRTEEATRLLKEALDAVERASPEGVVVAADIRVSLGNLRIQSPLTEPSSAADRADIGDDKLTPQQRRWKEAGVEYERALKVQRTVRGQDHLSVADTMSNLAAALRNQSLTRKAQTHYERALEITKARVGPSDLRVAATLKNMAAINFGENDYDLALSRYMEAAKIEEEDCHGDSLMELAGTYSNIAVVYKALEDWVSARTFYKKSAEVKRRCLDLVECEVAAKLPAPADLGQHLTRAHEHCGVALHQACSQAENALMQALRLSYIVYPDLSQVRHYREKHVRILYASLADTDHDLGNCLLKTKGLTDPREARAALERAFQVRWSVLGPDDPRVADSLRSLGILHKRSGDEAAAREHLEKARHLYAGVVDATDPRVEQINNLLD